MDSNRGSSGNDSQEPMGLGGRGVQVGGQAGAWGYADELIP